YRKSDHVRLVPQWSGERDVLGGRDPEPGAALGGELDRVGEKGPEHLLAPLNVRPFSAAIGRNVASRYSTSPSSGISAGCTSILPASTLDRSRMSLISRSRSEPASWMVMANSTCLPVRLSSGFSASSLASTSRLFSGVRSSCDM